MKDKVISQLETDAFHCGPDLKTREETPWLILQLHLYSQDKSQNLISCTTTLPMARLPFHDAVSVDSKDK